MARPSLLSPSVPPACSPFSIVSLNLPPSPLRILHHATHLHALCLLPTFRRLLGISQPASWRQRSPGRQCGQWLASARPSCHRRKQPLFPRFPLRPKRTEKKENCPRGSLPRLVPSIMVGRVCHCVVVMELFFFPSFFFLSFFSILFVTAGPRRPSY